MYKKNFKRPFDLLIFLLVFPLFVLILIIISPIIYLEDNGPVFYNSPRLGKNGKVFIMFKFRSMKINSKDFRNPDGSTYNSSYDNRLTKIGKFIRKTSLDELPQVMNVLKGEMSFIGPRPDLPEHISLYDENEKEKLLIRPGITGYNQAVFRNTIKWKDRIKNDIYYVNNISFLFDVKIILATIKILIFRRNVYVQKEINDEHE